MPVWSDASREAADEVRCSIWRTYRLLDEQVERTRANRDRLLTVLDRPDVPVHDNQREGDLRACVVRRKVSGGTRPDRGRACRDAFLTHMKTCARHRISFWKYLGHRLGIPGAEDLPWLPDLARQRPAAGPLLAHQPA